LWVFALTAVALLIIPGPAVLYVVVQGAEQGRRVGLASVAGIHLGTLVHVAAATVGLSALIVASSLAFNVVKYAGAAYLIYVGTRKLLGREEAEQVDRRRESLRRAFARGAVVNVLNPKTALFFLALLPQFVDTDRGGVWSQALVSSVFVALGLVSDSLYAVTAGWEVGRGASVPALRLMSCSSAGHTCRPGQAHLESVGFRGVAEDLASPGTRPHRPMARRQVDPGQVAQVGKSAEPRLAVFDGVFVCRRREPCAHGDAGDVEAGVVAQLGTLPQDSPRLRNGLLPERCELLLAQPVKVLVLRKLFRGGQR
jgi:threonine/homoserine/homoserine lactone efflux protein